MGIVGPGTFGRVGRVLLLAALTFGLVAGAASAQSKAKKIGTVTVVNATSTTFEFLPFDLGTKLGMWTKRGLDVKKLTVTGSGEVAQTLAAGKADIGLTAGTSGVAPIAKGLKAHFVAAIGNSFSSMVLVVPTNSPIKNRADLKGQTIGITSPGSLTDYLANLLGDVKTAPIGGFDEQLAALKTGATDGFIWTAEAAFALQEKSQGRVLLDFGSIVKNNVFEAIIASDDAIQHKPKQVQAYLDGWFETIRWMMTHENQTVAFMAKDFGVTPYVARSSYELDIDNLLSTGLIPAINVQNLAKASAAGGKPLPTAKFWTNRFVPACGECK